MSQEECEEPSLATSICGEQFQTPISREEEIVEQSTDSRNSRSNRWSSNDAADVDGLADAITPVSEGRSDVYTIQPSNQGAQRTLIDGGMKYERLNRKLISTWPTEDELKIIAALPVGISSHLHSDISRPCCSQVGLTTDEILRLHPPTSHPVLVARNLLRLGTFLQGVVPSSLKAMEDRGFSPHKVMHQIVDVAITCVTTQDEFLDSIEAVECIILEAMFHNYSGHLHRAWKATRRAITVAQSLAIHRGFSSPAMKLLEPWMRPEVDLDHLTFRLAQMDSYLSIMLGLPQSSLDTRRIISDTALAACNPTERMQRIHYLAQNRIIARSSGDIENTSETKDIDKVLQEAAAEMPPRWWLTPPFADATRTAENMVRLMEQFTHYHLLLRLHLPYVMIASSDNRYDYNKVVAVNTSREILTRFIAFHTNNTANYYCRGSDFLAFIAATVLCVAHILNSSNAVKDRLASDYSRTGFEFLAHTRLSDRGLMEHAVELVESTRDRPIDGIATKISRIMRDLLTLEDSASKGALYDARASTGHDEELECEGTPGNGERAMRVHIPHFGSIEFVKGTLLRSARDWQNTASTSFSMVAADNVGGRAVSWLDSDAALSNLGCLLGQAPSTNDSGKTPQQVLPETSFDFALDGIGDWNWDLQGVDVALFDSLFSGSTHDGGL